MRRRSALAIGLAALVAATSTGVIMARSDEGSPQHVSLELEPVSSGEETTPIDLGDGNAGDRANGGLHLTFSSCADLIDTARLEAVEHVGPWGWNGVAFGTDQAFGRGIIAEDEAIPAEASGAGERLQTDSVAAVAEEAGVEFSTTNVQERGIDEPDLVKTDGETIYVVAQSTLYAIDATTSEPRILSSVKLDSWGAQLLLLDNRLLVIGQADFYPRPSVERGSNEAVRGGAGATSIQLIDVSRPASMSVVETLSVEGGYVTARLTGRSVRLVTSSFPALIPFVHPQESGFIPEALATIDNRRIVASMSASDWLPEYVREDHATGASESGLAVECSSVRRASEDFGMGMLSVLTIDPSVGLSPVDSDGVMTSAQTVYASAESLYVATPNWSSRGVEGSDFLLGGRETTLVHRFDIAEADNTFYTGSGEVRGSLLNQFSMSEHDGYLRVATTDHVDEESFVSILDVRGEMIRAVGRVGNLGLGEQIYAVRFIGDTGYVVTFRQIDPLYTLDLSDPEEPRVLGELKIAGYSAYLHPIGEDLLLGIGQDANENGQTRGTQLSLFDVSDLEDPIRLHQARIGRGSSSEAEYDHHAFLWWPPSSMAILPVSAYSHDERTGHEEWFSGAVGAEVDRERGISSIGTLEHPRGSQIRRSLVIGDTLYTVSDSGVKASALETFAERGWLNLF